MIGGQDKCFCRCYDVAYAVSDSQRMMIFHSLPVLGLWLLVPFAISSPTQANIKDEFQRAQVCDYSNAEFISDVGVFDNVNVRFCISDDQKELIYVMAMGTSWVVPFERQYRDRGLLSFNTLEEDRLVLYQKENGVVKRKVLGRRR